DFGQAGSYTVTFTATDGTSATPPAPVVITIAHANGPPRFAPTPTTYALLEGATLTVAIAATDPDGDTATLSLDASAPPGATLQPNTAGTPTATATLVYAVPYNAAQRAQPVKITVNATDGIHGSHLDLLVTVTDVPQPPAFPAIGPLAAREGSLLVQHL